MGQETITKILLRRGTDADRQSVVLAAGEPGWTTDTNKLYIGDGSTPGGVEVSAASADLVTGFEHLSANNLYAYTDSDIKVRSDLVITKPGTYNSIEIGRGQTGDNYAYIDLVGDTTHTDYALRLIRDNTGANADSALMHRGSGSLSINAIGAGAVKLKTTNTDRLVVKPDGKVGIGTDAPNHELTVVGDISATGTIHGNAIQGAIGDTWTFLPSPVALTFDPAESVVVSSGANAGKLQATLGINDTSENWRFIPIAGLHGVPSNARYIMVHVYTGQADLYTLDPHGAANYTIVVDSSDNCGGKTNAIMGIGAIPFPQLRSRCGSVDPYPSSGTGGITTNTTLPVDGGLTGGTSEVYWPTDFDSVGMSRSDCVAINVVDQDADGTGVLHFFKILAYK